MGAIAHEAVTISERREARAAIGYVAELLDGVRDRVGDVQDAAIAITAISAATTFLILPSRPRRHGDRLSRLWENSPTVCIGDFRWVYRRSDIGDSRTCPR